MRAVPSGSIPEEQQVLEAARAGDHDAFRRLVEPYRARLHAHCYRMLGSLQDADDAAQETLLRVWRGLSTFEPGRPLRPWLYRIATNVCRDAIAKRPKRALPIEHGAAGDGDGAGEPLFETRRLEPYPDELLGLEDGYAGPEARYEQREAVELAFIAAIQHVPARQRAVLILRDVLAFSAREVAETLETTEASVNSALQRARKTVGERLPARSQQDVLRSLGDERARELVQRYVDAWGRRNVEALVALLAEDATFEMPPYPTSSRGRDGVIELISRTGTPPLRHLPTHANGQAAVAWYIWNAGQRAYLPTSLEVLALDDSQVTEITAFVLPELFARFRLPGRLPAEEPRRAG